MNLDKKKLIITALFVVFMFLRLFTSSPSFLLAADNLKYLEAARNFPYHTLYNNQLYLLHPFFYPYTIHFLNLFIQEDYNAAIAISLLSAIVTFFILYRFIMMLTNNFNIAFMVLAFFTLSVPFIAAANTALKESFVVMLTLLSLYYYVRAIKFINKKSLIASSIFGSLLAITTDHVIFIFPAFILSYIIFNREGINLKKLAFPNLKYAILPILFTLIFYGSWLSVRYYQYSNSQYYPNGLEGTPLNTNNLNILKLISPTFFEDFTESYLSPGTLTIIKKLIFQFGYMFNIIPFSIPLGLNFKTMGFLLFPKHIAYMLVLYLPLAIIALFGFFSIIRDTIKIRQVHNNVNLYMVGLFFIFLFPITQSMVSPRFIYTSYLFLFYFISYGFFVLFIRKRQQRFYSRLFIFSIILLLLLPFWYYHNPNFIFSRKSVVAAQNTADFINHNLKKEDAIMAQQGYGVKLIYLTGHRVIGLYPKPDKIEEIIRYFNIRYIVFGRHSTLDVYQFSTDSVEYVKNNPDKFGLVAAIQEDYSDFFVEGDSSRNDEIYIYKVKQ